MIAVLARVREHVDTIAVLLIAVILSALGFVHVASGETLANGILATLAVLSFSFIRERLRREVAEESFGADLGALRTELDGSAEMQVLTDSLIADAFEDARRDANWWAFSGGTGTYLRAVTMPKLAELSRRHHRVIDLDIQIIDPRNEALCAGYAHHAADVWPDDDSPWTPERVRLASYATILAACWYNEHYGLLRIRLGLTSSWSNFRYDLTPGGLIITVRDKGHPAYRVRSDKLFYRYWNTDLRISFDQACPVPLHRVSSSGLLPTPEEVRALFDAIGLPLNQTLADDAVQMIIDRALRPYRNQYV